MSFVIIIILSLVQGVTEFLPVSSSGHLVVLYNFFGITSNVIILSIFLHVATLLAVLVVYRKTVAQLIKKPFCKTNQLIAVATLPTIGLVLILESFIKQTFNGSIIIYCFLFTAALLYASQKIYENKTKCQNKEVFKTNNTNLLSKSETCAFNISFKQAFIIGCFQGVATIPGISRSGSSIAGGLIVGVNKNEVADFSFILSIPIIIASLFYELYNLKGVLGTFDFSGIELFFGFVVAFTVGYASLKFMVSIVKKQKLWVFSLYLLLLSLFLIIYGLVA